MKLSDHPDFKELKEDMGAIIFLVARLAAILDVRPTGKLLEKLENKYYTNLLEETENGD